ncbi:MAG: NUDIX hydrolase [Xanthomonadales bacterium]|nr:NUDIX hydrolase [Xanthomonadales bacterium]
MSETPVAPPEGSGIWRPRVTVATIVQRGEAFLLVEEDVRGARVFNQPAGHLEPGESLQQAAVRETLEETGWEVRPTCLVRVYQWRARSGREFLRFTFGAEALRHDPARPLDSGIVRAVWLTRDDLAADPSRLRSPMVLAGIDDWLAGRRLPLDAVARIEPAP